VWHNNSYAFSVDKFLTYETIISINIIFRFILSHLNANNIIRIAHIVSDYVSIALFLSLKQAASISNMKMEHAE